MDAESSHVVERQGPRSKAFDPLAGQLREAILSGEIPFGSSLPSERDLMASSGLSRASVREALRVLQSQGLVETRAGRNGGSRVRRPGPETVARSLDLFIHGQGIRYGDLLSVREGIEPMAAAQAAVRRTPEDVRDLDALTRACADAVGDIPAFVSSNLAWHLAVVRASRNPLFMAFMTSIAPAIHAATDSDELNPVMVRTEVVRIHARITDAIRAGDPAGARRRMERHLAAHAAQIEKVDPKRLGRRATGSPR